MAWAKGKGRGKATVVQPRPVLPRPAAVGRAAGAQSQAAQAAAAQAAAAKAAAAASTPSITVSGCQNVTIANIIKGSYTASGSNHGKPIYQKEGSFGTVAVLIYYWDERDGPNFHGWWFGPQVGGDQVWAYNGNKIGNLPPTTGWKVPWDGSVDPSVVLQHGGGAAAARPPARQVLPRPAVRAVNSKQLEEVQKRQADLKKRQEEAKAKREAEETNRKEQAAALAVRKAIQKVRTATPETYDELRAQLEETQATNLEGMGTQADKVSEEATKALEQAQKRIDDLHAKKLQEEQKKLEQEKMKKEMEEKVADFVKNSKDEATSMLAKVRESEEAAAKFQDGGDADSAEKQIEDVRAGAKALRLQIMEKQKEVADTESYKKVKREVMELTTKLAAANRGLDRAMTVLRQSKQRLAVRKEAHKKLAQRFEEFKGFDKDKDGALNHKELKAYCESRSLDLPQETVEKIMAALGNITVDKFRAMHQKLFIAHWEVIARRKAEEEEERRRQLEEKKQVLQSTLDEISNLLKTSEVSAADAEKKATSLIKSDKGSEEILVEASEIEEIVEAAEAQLAACVDKFSGAKELADRSSKEAPDQFGGLQQVKKLEQREARTKGQLAKITAALKLAREKAKRKAYAELDQKRTECATAIRDKMKAQEKSAEEFFQELNGGEDLPRENFLEFLTGLGLELVDGQREKLFDALAEAGTISKQGFKDLVRVFYKCVKATVMSQEISIKSKTLRRLEVGEVLEALAAPCNEETTRVMRVQCIATQDDLTGWVTVAGNQGTTFLEPGGNFYTCVKETALSEELSVESATLRRVAKGEVIEVLEFPKTKDASDLRRLKGKAKLDGAVGWISLANQGTVFLEPC